MEEAGVSGPLYEIALPPAENHLSRAAGEQDLTGKGIPGVSAPHTLEPPPSAGLF